jgi:hypothetical protein
MGRRLPQLFAKEPEQNRVLPLAVTQIRLPLDALLHVPDPLRVCDRALVEAVDLQLDPVEPEVDQEVPLELAGRLVAETTTSEAGREREAAGLGDSVPLVDAVEGDGAGALAVDLDDEPAERLGLVRRVLDLCEHRVGRVGCSTAEKRPRLLIEQQLAQEVGVVRPCPPQLDGHVADASSRRSARVTVTPVPSATPVRMRARPTNA